jgi:hypothetical protein
VLTSRVPFFYIFISYSNSMRLTLTLLLTCFGNLLLAQEVEDTSKELRLAELRMTSLLAMQDLESHDAKDSLAAAEYDLNLFTSFAKVNTEKSLRLDLLLEQDALSDATEELEQLKIMYDNNNLADVTAQMVLKRAERNLARQMISVELAKSEIDKWLQFGQFREQQMLNNAVTSAKLNLTSLQAEHTSSRVELSAEIDDLKAYLAELRAESSDE